jgi:hypothetical protein
MCAMVERPAPALAFSRRISRRLLLVALSVAPLAACYGPNAPSGEPCGTDNDCPSSQFCQPDTLTCESSEGREVWRDDTAADFAAPGAFTDEVAIEPAGFVGPVAYFGGGVRLSAIDRNAIPDQATPWNELAGLARTGTTFTRGLQIDFADAPPLGLGLGKSDDLTVVVEGEVYLDMQGMWRFELTANDIGFLELAPPGSTAFERVVTDADSKTEGYYNVTQVGWHRLRGAFADSSGTMSYELRYDSPARGNLHPIPASALRAPAGDVAGVIVDGFEDPYLMGPKASVVNAGTLGGLSLGTDPFGLPIGNSSYSLRFATQVLIDAPGSYALRIQSDQGHRAWLDGVKVVDKFDTSPQTTVTEPTQLEAGWHDLVVDLNRSNGTTAALDVTVAEGPVWSGQAIPLDHLRPVVGRATRWAGGLTPGSVGIPDGGTVTRNVAFDVQPDLVTSQIEVEFKLNHNALSQVEVKVDPPVGLTTTVMPANSVMGSGSYMRHAMMPASTAGASWNFLVTDTSLDGTIGTLGDVGVVLLGAAGPAPFAPTYRYVSAPHELGAVASFMAPRWSLRQGRPDAMVAVSLRTCDAAAACEGEAWTPIAIGAVPQVTPRRFAQYKIELAGIGDAPTALDWIEIAYHKR